MLLYVIRAGAWLPGGGPVGVRWGTARYFVSRDSDSDMVYSYIHTYIHIGIYIYMCVRVCMP